MRLEDRFENLKEFLASPEARKVVNSQQLKAMQQELAAAQVREAYWSGVSGHNEQHGRQDMPEADTDKGNALVLPLAPLGGNSWSVRGDTATSPWHSGKWSLWTFVGPGLVREDFETEQDARVAMNVQNVSPDSAPCMVSGPSGRQLDARSWRQLVV
jgi:hypothetical protein